MLVRTLEDGLLDALLPDARNVVVAPDRMPTTSTSGSWRPSGVAGTTSRSPCSPFGRWRRPALHTASALQTAALIDEVERLATRDALTGIANRRLFDESLVREAARAQRLNTPLSLVVFDIDHFKQINDTYGHVTGDSVLRTVAEAIVDSTKSFDVAARYGGDEFVLLLPGCNNVDAVGVAERVRDEIGRQALEVPVTVSAGLATMPDNAIDGDRLFSAADAALYVGEAQRPRPGRRVDPRGGRRPRRGAPQRRTPRPRRLTPRGAGRSPARAAAQGCLRSFDGRSPGGRSRRPRGARVDQRVCEEDSPENRDRGGVRGAGGASRLGCRRLCGGRRRCSDLRVASTGARPHRPALTDAQKQCLADQGVTLPQRPTAWRFRRAAGATDRRAACGVPRRRRRRVACRLRPPAASPGVRGAGRPRPLTDAQKQCLADHGVTLPQRPTGGDAGERPAPPTAEQRAALQQAAAACGITLPEHGPRVAGSVARRGGVASIAVTRALTRSPPVGWVPPLLR